MSYCRWSSDNWRCDLYCYESAQGFTTHVAGQRYVGHIPDDRWLDFIHKKITADEYVKFHKEQLDAVQACSLEDITLPHAGETFDDDDLESFKARLLHLRGLGYNFPDHVLDAVDAEIAEAAATERDHDP